MTSHGRSGRGRRRLWRLRAGGQSLSGVRIEILRGKVRWSLVESRREGLVLIQSGYGI